MNPNPNIIHRIKHFINFFVSIPKEKWVTNRYHFGDKHCAIGHLQRAGREKEGQELQDLLGPPNLMGITQINDGCGLFSSYGQDPQTRVLKALELRLAKETESK